MGAGPPTSVTSPVARAAESAPSAQVRIIRPTRGWAALLGSHHLIHRHLHAVLITKGGTHAGIRREAEEIHVAHWKLGTKRVAEEEEVIGICRRTI